MMVCDAGGCNSTAGDDAVTYQGFAMSKIEVQLEEVIERMQAIQRAIKSSGQPASRFELQALKDLGREYARLVDELETSLDCSSRD
jgi:hypothetical protein